MKPNKLRSSPIWTILLLVLMLCNYGFTQQTHQRATQLYDAIELSGSAFKIPIKVKPPPVITTSSKEGGGIPPVVWILTGAGGGVGIVYLVTSGDGTNQEEEDPIARDDVITVSCNGSVTFNPLSNDSGNNLIITQTSSVPGVDISFTRNSITISNPVNSDFNFNYTIRDDNNRTADASVSVQVSLGTISLINDEFSFEENSQVTGNVLTNDIGNALTITDYSQPSNGTLTITLDGAIIYMPNAGFCGSENLTYTAVDECQQQATTSITIVGNDNTAPTINCPPETTVSCAESTDPSISGEPEVEDNCSTTEDLSVTFRDDASTLDGCNNTGSLIRTWSVTDASSNTNSCDQIIHVEDNNPPKIECPPDASIACSDDTAPSITGTAEATDACGEATVEFIDNIDGINECNGTGMIIRTWAAQDLCDNKTSCTQTITIMEDTSAPFIECPPDVSIACADSFDPENTGMVSAMDDCTDESGIDIRYEDLQSDPLGCNTTVVRTWKATDPCGNESTCDQTITLQDQQAPSIVCPDNISIPCTQDPDTAITGLAEATDDCSESPIDLSFLDQNNPSSSCVDTIIRTWTSIDNCGNSSSCTQVIILEELHCDFVINTTSSNTGCGVATGSASAEIVTGPNSTGPYEIVWSDGQTGVSISGLSTGTYTVTIVDTRLGCEQVASVNIGENPPNFIQSFETIPISCVNPGDILLDLSSMGSGPFDVLVELPEGGVIEIPFVDNNSIFSLADYLGDPPAGEYVIIITDVSIGTACQEALAVQLDQQLPPEIFLVDIIPASGPTSNDGQIFIHTENGTLPLNVFVNENFIGAVNGFDFVINGVPPGEYVIYVEDGLGCISHVLEVFMEFGGTINVNTGLTAGRVELPHTLKTYVSTPEKKYSIDPQINQITFSFIGNAGLEFRNDLSFNLEAEFNRGSWTDSQLSNEELRGNFNWRKFSPFVRWQPSLDDQVNIYFDAGLRYHFLSLKNKSNELLNQMAINTDIHPEWWTRSGIVLPVLDGSSINFYSELIHSVNHWDYAVKVAFITRLNNHRKLSLPYSLNTIELKKSLR